MNPSELEKLANEYLKSKEIVNDRIRANRLGEQYIAEERVKASIPITQKLEQLEERITENDKALAESLQNNEKEAKKRRIAKKIKSEIIDTAGASRGQQALSLLNKAGDTKTPRPTIQGNPVGLITFAGKTILTSNFQNNGVLSFEGNSGKQVNIPLDSQGKRFLFMNHIPTDDEWDAIRADVNAVPVFISAMDEAVSNWEKTFSKFKKIKLIKDMVVLEDTSSETKGDGDGDGDGEPKGYETDEGFRDAMAGEGLYVANSHDGLIKKLALCCASKNAGNKSAHLDGQINDILDHLLRSKIIKKSHHKKMWHKWVDR